MLPTILYAAGFNMRRKELFQNFANISKFGIFGSIFTFIFYTMLTKLFFMSVNVTMWDPKLGTSGEYTKFELSTVEILIVCAMLTSSDIVAAMSLLHFEEAPHIFSIVVGEGLLNDVVVIVLYQTCVSLADDST